MTLIIASAHGAVPENLDGADLLEIRVDGIETNEAIQLLPSLLKQSPIPTIVTCRSISEGGFFDGEEEERVSIYNAALGCDSPPKYIDIEHEILLHHPLLIDSLTTEETGIILSWHDTKGRPKDLLQRAVAMQDVAGVAIVKIVWRARSIRDNIEAFELLRTKQQPTIVLCMGEYGTMSRVLAPKFGGFATFASVDGSTATASGQISIAELQSVYDFCSINTQTKVYGVIGNNVSHSASPAFHNAAFQVTGNNSVYLPLQVPEGWEHLKASFEELRSYEPLHFSGASITIPHKEEMIKLATECTPECASTGATNTIAILPKHIEASNTDVTALTELLQGSKKTLVLGTGGVARAAIIALQKCKSTVHIAGRTNKKVRALATEYLCQVASEHDDPYDTIVQCTPVGMLGGNSPDGNSLEILAPWVSLCPSMHVLDTVYVPEQTPLLLQADKSGCKITNGNTMFRLQAAAQQAIWS